MYTKILLLAFSVAALSSCSTAYKTGQTPDDVYYSPMQKDRYEERRDRDRDEYVYTDQYYDDRYLRMKVANRYRWNDLNDWYGYDRYSFGYNYHYASFYNPYNNWNYFYNPYYSNVGYYGFIKNPMQARPIVRPTSFNASSYGNVRYNNNNTQPTTRVATGYNPARPTYNNQNNTNSNSGSNGSKRTRTIYENTNRSYDYGNNNNSGSNSGSSGRSYTPSSSGSSSSGSSSSGSSSSGGGVSRPGRN